MRTLIYCTAYAEHTDVWNGRYRMWLDAVLQGGLNPDQVLLVDDGSPVLPGWRDLALFSGDMLGEGFTVGPRGRVLLFHFRERLGRIGLQNFPGWHRSYCFGALYAEANGFDRVIHIESDAYLITQKARDWALGVRNGWVAPWSERYGMPELAISVAEGEGLRLLASFARQPYAAIVDRVHERVVPFSTLEMGLRGDRYGETALPVPDDADYAAQVPWQREPGYFWWLPGRERRPPAAQTVTLRFGEGGNGVPALDGGWGEPEENFCWMLGAESILRVPALPGEGDGVLRLGVVPCLDQEKHRSQRLIVNVAGRAVQEFHVTHDGVLGCVIPAPLLRQQGTNLLRLVHPDAVAPATLVAGNNDTRRLSFGLEWLTFER